MNVLLANPPCLVPLENGNERYYLRSGSRWPASITKRREENIPFGQFPFFLAYTAALLEKVSDINVMVHDSILLNFTEEAFLSYLTETRPDLLFFEVPTITVDRDCRMAERIKQAVPGIVIAVGGPHPTVFATELLKACTAIDYCFLREYELNFRDLVLALQAGRGADEVKGVAYRNGSDIVMREGSLIDPLDQLPHPARHLFPSREQPGAERYWESFAQSFPLAQMHASRGCPYRCNFCLWNQVMYQNGKYRTFSASYVVDEMLDCATRYHVKEIYFDDDTFTGNRRHVLELCDEMIRRDVPRIVAWSAMADAIVTDEEMINRMADAGCIGLKFGVESGDEGVLRQVGKPLKLEKTKQFVKWCARRHIKTHATFTFGLSGDTPETMRKTLAFALDLDSDSAQFSINTPFPGTRYYEELKAKNLLRSTNWADYDGHCRSVAEFEHMTTADVDTIFHSAYRLWLRRKLTTPAWVWRQAYNWNRLRQRRGTGYALALLLRLFRGSI